MRGDRVGDGLSSAAAARRLERDGPNVLPRRPPVRWWQRLGAQLRDPLIVVLLVAALLTAATGDWPDMAVILLVVVVNTAVGVWQEIRADQAITALTELTAPHAQVVRDGAQAEVPSTGIVRGDLVVLAEGDIVPADGDLVEAAGLLVDESALTGESVPVDKAVPGEVAAGTVVVRGRGLATVTATGAASATGRIAGLMGEAATLTPLQRRLADVGRLLAAVTVVLGVIVLVIGLAKGQGAELMVVTAISLVVAAVPESLPAVVTLSLALGARRMAAREALVRRLPAVETLGSVTVLTTDKTGTLTEGRMVARALWTPEGEAAVTGSGYDPRGEVTPAGPAVEALLTAGALCNDAHLAFEGDEWTALGDPTEAALLAAAERGGLDTGALRERLPRVAERPFDSDRKRMTTVHRLGDGRVRVVCKGAPEAVFGLLAEDTPAAADRAARFADAGFRVLAVASADRAEAGDPESGLSLLGLVAILDPPRASAARTLAACREAGVEPVLITGDHPGTARAVAADLGIVGPGEPAVDCRTMTGDIPDAVVFARATPHQKLEIVEALRTRGEVVAMTGDGVNDGPALRRADIGVAMGRRGTEVARQAADLVLADDELGTVVAAVEEGRRVYDNIRRFLVYGLSGGAAEIVVMLAGPFAGLELPLLPAQILWINLLTHGLPGVAIGGEPAEPGTMRRPPRPPNESILGAGLWQRVVRVGLVLSVLTLGVAVWAHHEGRPWQTMAFFALGAAQLGVALGSRARQGSRDNPLLLVAVGAAFLLQLAALYVPFLRDLLSTEALGPADLLIVLALSVLGYAAVRLDRALHH